MEYVGGDTENTVVSGFKYRGLVGRANDKNKNKNIRAEIDISVSLTLARTYNYGL